MSIFPLSPPTTPVVVMRSRDDDYRREQGRLEEAASEAHSDAFIFATADLALFEPCYHVPRSQVWEGSRGSQRGNVHLHVRERFDHGRIHRQPGQALCGRRAWYPRALHQDEVATACPRCAEIAGRLLV